MRGVGSRRIADNDLTGGSKDLLDLGEDDGTITAENDRPPMIGRDEARPGRCPSGRESEAARPRLIERRDGHGYERHIALSPEIAHIERRQGPSRRRTSVA